ncbi:MAG: hypothetical protein ACOCVL_03340 [Candidatus Sumerlaeota bacterium]
MRKIEAELYSLLPIQDITLLIRNGEVIVKRGQAPAPLVNAVADMARDTGTDCAVIHGPKGGSTLGIKMLGIPRILRQRCRNIWAAYT